MLRPIAACVLSVLTVSACAPYHYALRVETEDPSAVTVRSADGQAPLLNTGSPHTNEEAIVSSGAFATSPTTGADYTISAQRIAGRGLRLQVRTGLALERGEHFLLVDDRGDFLPLPLEHPASPIGRGTSDFAVRLCGGFRADSGEDGPTVYDFDLRPRCEGRTQLAMELATPWSNVREVREERRTAGPWVFLLVTLLSTVSLVLPGAYLTTINAQEPAPLQVTGWSMVGLGSAAILSVAPFLFATDDDRILYSAGGN